MDANLLFKTLVVNLEEGKILETLLQERGMTQKRFAELMKIGRNTPGRWFKEKLIKDGHLLKACEKLRVNVKDYFPRFENEYSSVILEPREEQDLHDSALFWKEKYYENLEKYVALLEEHTALLNKTINNKTK